MTNAAVVERLRKAWRWRLRAHRIRRFAAALRRQALDRPLVVIAMPGSLHVAWLAVQKIPPAVPWLLVLNGMAPWEVRLARRLFAGRPVVACGALMDHDEVLDLLFDNLNGDFGILDYDCFVLDPAHFEPMRRLAPGVLMNACFSRVNSESGLRVPETFFLFFNRAAIQSLRARYGVSCSPVKWRDLGGAAAAALTAAGFGQQRLPEAHKDYFDTLRVLMMLGVADGMKLEFLADFPATPAPSGEIFHVGGISNPRQVDGLWRFRGVYFWRRVLESCPFSELRSRYAAIYGSHSAAEHRHAYPAWAAEVGDEFFAFCDRIIVAGAGQAVADA